MSYLSTPSRIDLFRFQARGRRRRPNLALVFVLMLCGSIFCYRCMFAFVAFDLVSSTKPRDCLGRKSSK